MTPSPGLKGRRIHFAGIGGIGMSALARWARWQGAVVDGCDREASESNSWIALDASRPIFWTGLVSWKCFP